MTTPLRKVYAGAAGHWDSRRNTSQVRAADPRNTAASLAQLARSRHQAWYRWIVNRQNGVHDHAAVRANGERAACPVIGCTEPLDP